jgi:hypothetical protein
MNTDTLWPRVSTPERKAPVTILREQGAALGQMTSNIIYGYAFNVRNQSSYSNRGTFVYAFNLESSPLSYSYRLFTISHDIELYPVAFIEVDNDILKELEMTDKQIVATSEEELLNWLKKIFNSQKTVGIIEAVLAQTATA